MKKKMSLNLVQIELKKVLSEDKKMVPYFFAGGDPPSKIESFHDHPGKACGSQLKWLCNSIKSDLMIALLPEKEATRLSNHKAILEIASYGTIRISYAYDSGGNMIPGMLSVFVLLNEFEQKNSEQKEIVDAFAA